MNDALKYFKKNIYDSTNKNIRANDWWNVRIHLRVTVESNVNNVRNNILDNVEPTTPTTIQIEKAMELV